jgi:two-component system, LytTR family, response regulator AlgR
MTLKVLIVDDEALARARLRTLLADCREPAALVGAEAGHAAQAMEALQHGQFDLALIDIHMPGTNGLSLAASLRRLPHPPAVIFVTAHAEHALTAFELEAADYLTKPVRLPRLQAALSKVARLLALKAHPATTDEFLSIQDRGRTERIPLAQVLYFKAELKYLTVRTTEKSHIMEGALGELEALYPSQFLRIHRNALVARHAVRALEKHHDPEEGDGWALRLVGVTEPLSVSRRQLAAVKSLLAPP